MSTMPTDQRLEAFRAAKARRDAEPPPPASDRLSEFRAAKARREQAVAPQAPRLFGREEAQQALEQMGPPQPGLGVDLMASLARGGMRSPMVGGGAGPGRIDPEAGRAAAAGTLADRRLPPATRPMLPEGMVQPIGPFAPVPDPRAGAGAEFARGLSHGAAAGLPTGIRRLPVVGDDLAAWQERERLMRGGEGVAGFVGEAAGSFAAMANPADPAGMPSMLLGVGMADDVARVVAARAGPRVASAVKNAIEGLGGGAAVGAAQRAGQIPAERWKSDPVGATLEVLGAAAVAGGLGAAAGGGLGAAFGGGPAAPGDAPAPAPRRPYDPRGARDFASAYTQAPRETFHAPPRTPKEAAPGGGAAAEDEAFAEALSARVERAGRPGQVVEDGGVIYDRSGRPVDGGGAAPPDGGGDGLSSRVDRTFAEYDDPADFDTQPTQDDVVDEIESIAEEFSGDEAAARIRDAVAKYRSEQDFDTEIAGRNDMNEAFEAFEADVRAALTSKSPAPKPAASGTTGQQPAPTGTAGQQPPASTNVHQRPPAPTSPRLSGRDLRRQFQEVTGSKEQADALYALVEARARASGETTDEYIGKRIAGVFKGTRPWEGALRQDEEPVFFSAAKKAVGGFKDPKARMSGPQWRAWLKNQPGIKAEELEWLGLEDAPGRLSREDAAQWIDANGVQVKEKVLGAKEGRLPDGWTVERLNAQEAEDMGAKEGDWVLLDEDGSEVTTLPGRLDEAGAMRAGLHSAAEAGVDITHFGRGAEAPDTKFSEYQTPGGENYRELLLTMPVDRPGMRDTAAQRLYHKPYAELPPEQQAQVLRDMREDPRGAVGAGQAFAGGHFDEPNVLAHVRFNERTVGGKRVLFIEEIQSDWHQKGRRQGYKVKTPEALTEADLRVVRNPSGQWEATDPANMAHYGNSREAAIEAAVGSWRRRDHGGVPNAPFKQSWPALALKRMMRWAADNGYDAVAWTKGARQAERYDLSKQIDSLSVFDDGGGKYRISAYKDGHPAIEKGGLDPAGLEEHIGKDLAKRAVDDLAKSRTIGATKQHVRYDGLDLKVGGEGMEGFYDRILPAEANRIAKKWGGRVREGTIPFHNPDAQPLSFREWLKSRGHPDPGSVRTGDPLWREFLDTTQADQLEPAWIMDVTAGMRDSARRGFPMFQGAKGAVNFLEDGRAVIHAFKAADVSTMVHELGHVFRRDLSGEDLATAAKWAGAKDGEWSVAAEEKFARGFERYLRTGNHPDSRMRYIFQKFKEWLTQVYRTIRGSPLEAEIPKAMRKVYDRLFIEGTGPASTGDLRGGAPELRAKEGATPKVASDATEPPTKTQNATPDVASPGDAVEPPVTEKVTNVTEEVTPPRDPTQTSARKAWTAADREAMGLDEPDSPSQRSWKAALEEAESKGLHTAEAASRLAADTIANPRAWSDIETAGMVRRGSELKNQHAALADQIAKATDPADIADLSAKMSRVQDEFDALTTAMRMSGTEKGRALAAQKLTLDRDYRLVSVLARAKASKGKALTPAEKGRIEALTKQLEEATKRADAAEAKLKDIKAEEAIRQHKAGRAERNPAKRKATRTELVADLARLVKAGCDRA